MLSFGGREDEERMKFDFLCVSSHWRGPLFEIVFFFFFTGFHGCFIRFQHRRDLSSVACLYFSIAATLLPSTAVVQCEFSGSRRTSWTTQRQLPMQNNV